MVYLELFNGRETEDQVMSDFGAKGPVIGPLPYDSQWVPYGTKSSIYRSFGSGIFYSFGR